MTTSTKEIVTPAGTKFVINETITYGQHRQLVEAYLNKTDPDEVVSAKADRLGFGFVVVSIDGETEKLYEKFLDLSYPDVTGILEVIKEKLSPKV